MSLSISTVASPRPKHDTRASPLSNEALDGTLRFVLSATRSQQTPQRGRLAPEHLPNRD